MGKCKNSLLTALLSAGLVFGAGKQEAKAQPGTEELNISFYDKNENEFPKIMICNLTRGLYEDTTHWRKGSGTTLIGYYDADNTGFYEFIKILNFDHPPPSPITKVYLVARLTEEKFKINENSGLIDYTFKKFYIDMSDYERKFKNYVPSKILEIDITKENYSYLNQVDQKTHFNLTEEKLYNISPELRDRIENLIVAGKDAYKDKSRLEDVLKFERLNSYATIKE